MVLEKGGFLKIGLDSTRSHFSLKGWRISLRLECPVSGVLCVGYRALFTVQTELHKPSQILIIVKEILILGLCENASFPGVNWGSCDGLSLGDWRQNISQPELLGCRVEERG